METKPLVTPVYSFDRSKLFYPLIMNFAYSLHGFIEFTSKGIAHSLSELNRFDSDNLFDNDIFNMDIDNKNYCKPFEKPSSLIGDLEFKKHDESSVKIDTEQITYEISDKGHYLSDFLLNSACTLLISSHAKAIEWDDHTDPVWNFFFYCQNACVHNNRFKIDTLRFPAKWRDLEITIDSDQTPLFKENDEYGLLYSGDAIALLWDIEQHYLLPKSNDSSTRSAMHASA